MKIGIHATGDLDRDGHPELVLHRTGNQISLRVRLEEREKRVLCRDAFGVVVGDFPFSPLSEEIGSCAPTGSVIDVSAFGFNPREITAAGVRAGGPFVAFQEPVRYTPGIGGSVVCRSIEVRCAPSSYRDVPYSLACRVSSIPEMHILQCATIHLQTMQQFGLGQAELVADRSPERVRVGNIGSSGQDGVTLVVGGAGGELSTTDQLSFNYTKIEFRSANPTAEPADLTLQALGTLHGVALQSLVTCRLSLQPFGGALVVHSDFSALGSTTTRVVVVSGGTVVGEYRVANGDVAHLP